MCDDARLHVLAADLVIGLPLGCEPQWDTWLYNVKWERPGQWGRSQPLPCQVTSLYCVCVTGFQYLLHMLSPTSSSLRHRTDASNGAGKADSTEGDPAQQQVPCIGSPSFGLEHEGVACLRVPTRDYVGKSMPGTCCHILSSVQGAGWGARGLLLCGFFESHFVGPLLPPKGGDSGESETVFPWNTLVQ